MNDPKGRTEPNAEMRQLAAVYWQMFIALIREGFTEHQALMLLGQMMAAAQMGGSDE